MKNASIQAGGCLREGLSVPASVHRDTRSSGRDVRELLANVVGEQLQHCRHAHQTARSRQGRTALSPMLA